MKKLVIGVIVGVIAAAATTWALRCRTPATDPSAGYWLDSCVTRDGRFLVAGGDHAALVELSSGRIVERLAQAVVGIGCEESGALILGSGAAWRMPGKTAVVPMPQVAGHTLVNRNQAGEWVSHGTSSVFVGARKIALLPSRFGAVGQSGAPNATGTFASHFGNQLEDGRLLVASGWVGSAEPSVLEDPPWGFFALNPTTGKAAPLTMPLRSDEKLRPFRAHQHPGLKLASTWDAMHLVIAANDPGQVQVARFEQGANLPSRVTAVPTQAGAADALAISDDGAFIAVATPAYLSLHPARAAFADQVKLVESSGPDEPAQARVIDQSGRVIWNARFEQSIVGLHFLGDGSLVIAVGDATAVRVAVPSGAQTWRTR